MLDQVINHILSDISFELHNKNHNLNDSHISVVKAENISEDFDVKISRLTSLLEVLTELFSLQSQSDRQIEHSKVNRCFKLVVSFISIHSLPESPLELLN
jgi:hypothetical protein